MEVLLATSHHILVCLHTDRVDSKKCLRCSLVRVIKKAAFTLYSWQMRGECVKGGWGA